MTLSRTGMSYNFIGSVIDVSMDSGYSNSGHRQLLNLFC
jgi:hypothetical protein